MTTVTLQRPFNASQSVAGHRVVGSVTGNAYYVDGLGRVTVDTRDAPAVLAKGWLYANISDLPGAPTSGVTTVDFGAFPGSNFATVTLTASDIFDPSAILLTEPVAVATADHTADEHLVDAPLVSAVSNGDGTITVNAVPNNNVPKIDNMMPWGKWSVAWAFLQ